MATVNISSLIAGVVAGATGPTGPTGATGASGATTTISNGTSNLNIATSGGAIYANTAGTNAITVDTSQNVGIGTASPAGNLQISGSGDRSLLVTGGTSGTISVQLGDSAAAGQGGMSYDNFVDALFFKSNGSERMRIDAGGNTNIGVLANNNVFDQVGGARPLLVQKSDTSTTIAGSLASITISNGDTTTNNTAQLNFAAITGASTNQYSSAVISAIFGARTNGQYSTGQLVFSTSTSLNAAPTEKMRIDSSGNVGIGTSSPTKRLQVESGSTAAGGQAWSHSSGTVYARIGVVNPGTNNDTEFGTVSNNDLHFITNNTERMRIDTSGNVGIGTTSPAANLEVKGASGQNIYVSYTSGSQLRLKSDSGDSAVGTTGATPLLFLISNGEKARIDSSGNLLLGRTTQISSEKFGVEVSGSNQLAYLRSTGTSGDPTLFRIASGVFSGSIGAAGNFIYCEDGGSAKFYVKGNGGIANFSASNTNLSDRREKTNFAPAGEYLSKICNIPVQTFNYIDQNLEDDGDLTLGVVAQDVQEVAPELVTESNWGTEESPKMRLSIYQTDLQYALMKCIQELKAINDTQAETINAQATALAALTARIVALEAK